MAGSTSFVPFSVCSSCASPTCDIFFSAVGYRRKSGLAVWGWPTLDVLARGHARSTKPNTCRNPAVHEQLGRVLGKPMGRSLMIAALRRAQLRLRLFTGVMESA